MRGPVQARAAHLWCSQDSSSAPSPGRGLDPNHKGKPPDPTQEQEHHPAPGDQEGGARSAGLKCPPSPRLLPEPRHGLIQPTPIDRPSPRIRSLGVSRRDGRLPMALPAWFPGTPNKSVPSCHFPGGLVCRAEWQKGRLSQIRRDLPGMAPDRQPGAPGLARRVQGGVGAFVAQEPRSAEILCSQRTPHASLLPPVLNGLDWGSGLGSRPREGPPAP